MAARKPVPRETSFPKRRNTPETERRLSGYQNHTGTATMQFFLDLISEYACCQHLVSQPLGEDEL
ncbi:hypothetical protein JIR23_14900 [Bradyrhizobium diazoefficiens]|nr:hypothetical protein JIR23_14900 [Bradyrhizobium diazoefficiens]